MEEKYQALGRLETEVVLEKLLVVRRVKAHVTKESRRQVKDKMNINADGNEKADD